MSTCDAQRQRLFWSAEIAAAGRRGRRRGVAVGRAEEWQPLALVVLLLALALVGQRLSVGRSAGSS